MTTVSPTQLAVLRWLAAYPGITIGYNPPHGYVTWSAEWRNEAARRHMVGALPHLGIDGSFTRPRDLSLADCPTPRLTKPTFLALFKRGLLQRTKVQVDHDGLMVGQVWGLSARGLDVATLPVSEEEGR
jgi:hypothetical protein